MSINSKDQVRLAVELAARMSATPPSQLGIILSQLGIKGLEPRAYDPWDIEAVVHDFVGSMDRDNIITLAEYYDIDMPRLVESKGSATEETTRASAFISYDSADKLVAGQVSEKLAQMGVKNFLAHRDIAEGRPWRTELTKELNSAAVMVCLIGENYHRRPICSQEIGWAWARGLTVIPCSIHESVNPKNYGLLDVIQFTFHRDSIEDTSLKLIRQLLNESPQGNLFVDALVDRLAQSGSFETAKERWAVLSLAETLSLDQISKIANLLRENDQVRKANHGKLEHSVKSQLTTWSDKAK